MYSWTDGLASARAKEREHGEFIAEVQRAQQQIANELADVRREQQKILAAVESMTEVLKEMHVAMLYRPGGPGYDAAAYDFEARANAAPDNGKSPVK